MKRLNLLSACCVLFLVPLLNSCLSDADEGDEPPSIAPPTNVTAAPGNGQVTVSWDYTLGNNATFNVVYSIASGGNERIDCEGVSGGGLCIAGCKTQGLSCTVDGLTNGESYLFTVRAVFDSASGYYDNDSVTATPTAN